MILFLTVLILLLIPFAGVGLCVLSDCYSGITLAPMVYSRLFMAMVIVCSVIIAMILLVRAFPGGGGQSSPSNITTNACEQVLVN